MRKLKLIALIGIIFLGISTSFGQSKYRRLPVNEYIDKMKAGWIGQMAGVGQGGPTEFKWKGKIIPKDKVPKWEPKTINQFGQDDLYVEMTFLRTLEVYGLCVSAKQAGIDFANSNYGLWHANRAGRNNLRSGIAPPDSGHPQFNEHADDIDYQIEADFSGLIAPGLPNTVIELGEKFGGLMNYGDGLYGGQFVGGMYAEAFFESDIEKIIKAGLKCIPTQSQYAECILDVLKWHRQNPNNWEKTWKFILEKYQNNPDYRKFSCSKGNKGIFNIDAKINGAYIVMGMLYGEGDIDKTIVISARCGQDSDCNPSNAAGVLCTTIGFSKLPKEYTSALKLGDKFKNTTYNFPELVSVCEKLTKQAIVKAGGRIEKSFFNILGGEVFIIPAAQPKPSKFVQCWAPGPIADSKYNKQQMTKITGFTDEQLYKDLEKFAPGWNISYCGNCDGRTRPGLYNEKADKKNVFSTHPLGCGIGCVLSKNVKVPAGKKSSVKLTVGHQPKGDWQLIVKANGAKLFSKIIGKSTTQNGWADVDVDISEYAGKAIKLELVNYPNNWSNDPTEIAYWHKIAIVSE
ncbi:MAG: ADP-ribosylglycohydrolase family protein [Planctomycetota bacterium]|jgi:hypothetical protein